MSSLKPSHSALILKSLSSGNIPVVPMPKKGSTMKALNDLCPVAVKSMVDSPMDTAQAKRWAAPKKSSQTPLMNARDSL